MENATKALLIAAAVLIAILIISLGIVIYTQASETVNSVNMSQQEVQTFNDQFLKYQGSGKRGTEVNALIKAVVTNNNAEDAEESSKIVQLTAPGGINITGTATQIPKVDAAKVYNVEVTLDTTSGLVTSIEVTE